MSNTRTVARNVIWNTAGMASHLLAGFIVAPFLVHRLGETGYGLWILIASMTSYFGNLDLGVSGSVGRNLAYYLARKDDDNVRGILSTAFALMTGVAGVLALAIPGILLLFFTLFEVEPDQVETVRLALILICINLIVSFPLNLFDGTLWALQRFDLQNLIDIPCVVLRTVLTFMLVNSETSSLVTLSVIVLAVALIQGFAKIIVSFWLEPALRVRLSAINFASARTLFDYGIWFFLLTGSKTFTGQVGPTVVGNRLGAALVTPFRIGAQLANYANTFMIHATQVLTPVATSLHASDNKQQQRRMFLEGGRACMILSLYIAGAFYFLGKPLIVLWIGTTYEISWLYLMLIIAGEILPMSQWISQSVLLGANRHKRLATYSLLEIPASLGLALLLVESHGLIGVCVGLAIPATLFRGILQMHEGCKLMNMSMARYVVEAFLPGLIFVLPHVALLGIACSIHAPYSWLTLVVYGGVSGVIFFACLSTSLLGWQTVRSEIARRLPLLPIPEAVDAKARPAEQDPEIPAPPADSPQDLIDRVAANPGDEGNKHVTV